MESWAEEAHYRLEDLGIVAPDSAESWATDAASATGLCTKLRNLLSSQAGLGAATSFSSFDDAHAFASVAGCPYLQIGGAGTSRVAVVDFLATQAQVAVLLAQKGKLATIAAAKNPSREALSRQSTEWDPCIRRLNQLLSQHQRAQSSTASKYTLLQSLKRLRSDLRHAKQEKSKCGDVVDAKVLTAADFDTLARLEAAMAREYASRKSVLLQRLDVTLQSFLWSPRAQGTEVQIIETLKPMVVQLHSRQSSATARAAIDADASLLQMQNTPVTEFQARTSVKGVRIGHVPDRGGRPREVRPKDLMPSWAPRRGDGRSGGRGGRNGGSRRSDGRDGRRAGGSRRGRSSSGKARRGGRRGQTKRS